MIRPLPEEARARMDAVFGLPVVPRQSTAREAFISGMAGGAIRGVLGVALQPVAQNQLSRDRVAVVQARHHHHHPIPAAAQNGQVSDGVYAGGAEILGGALLCILFPIFPLAGTIGAGLIIDGIRRTLNAGEQNPNLQAAQNPVPPPQQGGINF